MGVRVASFEVRIKEGVFSPRFDVRIVFVILCILDFFREEEEKRGEASRDRNLRRLLQRKF
jgi:hypothetical protein